MANPDLAFGALAKPSKLDRQMRKHAAKTARQSNKRKATRVKWGEEAAIRKACYIRDGGKCRATGVDLRLITDNPAKLAHCHHIVFRSAGGSDQMHNRITLSPIVHEQIHRHEVDCDGDGNGAVTFTVRDCVSGQIRERWTSPCPTGRTDRSER